MINFDDVVKEDIKEHNPDWLQIPNHPYRILTIGGCTSGKTNSLFNPNLGGLFRGLFSGGWNNPPPPPSPPSTLIHTHTHKN